MNRRTLDSFCERGIVGLVLAALVFSALATGAVRALEFAVVEWLVAGAALLWIVRLWLEPRRNRLLFPPVGVCLLLFLAYALFHYTQADVEYTARGEVLRLLVYALLFFVALNNLHKSEWTQLTLYVLVFTGVAIAVYGIVQVIAELDHVWHFTRPEQYRGRGSGTFINPNHFAGYLGMLLPLCLASVLTGRISQPMRILMGYSALLLLGGVAVSMSRGGWISTSLALVAVICVLGWRRQFSGEPGKQRIAKRDFDNLRIADLSLDCNWIGMKAVLGPSLKKTAGIDLLAKQARVERVLASGFGAQGGRPSWREVFPIRVISAMGDGSKLLGYSDSIIEIRHCIVEGYVRGPVSYTHLTLPTICSV